MNFDETNKTISLKANKHYVIHFSTRLFDSSDYGDFIFYNETENTAIKTIQWASNNIWLYHELQLIYTPTVEINVSIKATSTGDIQYLEGASLTIYEI